MCRTPQPTAASICSKVAWEWPALQRMPLRAAGADEPLGAGQLRGDRRRDDAVGELEILLVLGGDRRPHRPAPGWQPRAS